MPRDEKSDAEIQRLLTHIRALEAERDRLKKRDRNYQSIFDRVTDRLATDRSNVPAQPSTFNGFTFVIAYYDIPDQIERTLTSCSPAYQGMEDHEIEVIIVDNGSTLPLPEGLQERHPHISKILRFDDHPSPVFALNQGIAAAQFEMIAVMIDGAHMLSPGVVRNARDAWQHFPNPVINVPQYILGLESQNLTQQTDAFAKETADLANLGWPENGYSLFEYAVYPGENYHRTYVEAIETNCLITTRDVLDRFGGFDERYSEPGAGFANLEIFSRLIHEPENSYITLSGEGSFHQDHRGTTTQRSPEERDQLVAQFKIRHEEVTGTDTILNARSAILFGKTRRQTQRIPTISREFGRVSNRILKQLANIYVGRTRAALKDNYEPVLAVGGAADERRARTPLEPRGMLAETAERNGVPEKRLGYLRCLRQVHEALRPKMYFEIGMDTGASLTLARCPAVGVDPAFTLTNAQNAPRHLFREKSDDFFADHARCAGLFPNGIDLAFIDGMHLAEFVVRDFIETEKWMRKGGVIMLDDVLPDRMEMLERDRRFNAWCGDVYKIVPILRKYRPDLTVSVFETFIGPYRKGLALVSGLDPENRVLEQNYDEIAAGIADGAFDVHNIEELETCLAPVPIKTLTKAASAGRRGNLTAALTAPSPAETLRGAAVPETPKLSLVIVAYDMARELPRTLQSLAPAMQRGLAAEDYEIIVVDNASQSPADLSACAAIAPNTRFITVPERNVSPCHAGNIGLAVARADFVGLMIDGARMASPGLLSGALNAYAGNTAAVIGSHGFHLGQEVQSLAVTKGYDQAAEDALLDKAGWQEDGYRLFDISVFSKSSGKGWRVLPSESNALFLHRDRWRDLDGLDEDFRSPGGGLVNLDLWKRACEIPNAAVKMLLGEGTFHQIHGGVTTSSATSRRAEFDHEYEALRFAPYARPTVTAEFVGKEPARASASNLAPAD
ncbi:MAG: glycosyltransferase [Mangrovicoccus sp.]|nr:glycosyltransferase [Mangrovicoccus sp.]